MLADTREQHEHAAGGYVDRRASCDRAARILGVRALRDVGVDDLDRASDVLDAETFRAGRHVVTENERVLAAVAALRAGGLESDPAALGALLTASHASMRDDFEITTPALDLAAATAVEAGAAGARMTGGGFGGAVIALVASDRAADTADAITAAFARAGFTAAPAEHRRPVRRRPPRPLKRPRDRRGRPPDFNQDQHRLIERTVGDPFKRPLISIRIYRDTSEPHLPHPPPPAQDIPRSTNTDPNNTVRLYAR